MYVFISSSSCRPADKCINGALYSGSFGLRLCVQYIERTAENNADERFTKAAKGSQPSFLHSTYVNWVKTYTRVMNRKPRVIHESYAQ